VGGKGKEAVPSEEQRRSGNAWSSDKAARAEGLRRRREEMVLEARRKMEARVRGEV
jgi:coupling of ubiquitin conjugation to ER degradation protein 1